MFVLNYIGCSFALCRIHVLLWYAQQNVVYELSYTDSYRMLGQKYRLTLKNVAGLVISYA